MIRTKETTINAELQPSKSLSLKDPFDILVNHGVVNKPCPINDNTVIINQTTNIPIINILGCHFVRPEEISKIFAKIFKVEFVSSRC
jgi:hypothetical protein